MSNKYYYDTEFIEGTQQKTFLGIPIGKTKPTIDLISIGIVADDGREYYAISKDFNLKEAWNRYDEKEASPAKKYMGFDKERVYWIRENVLKPIWEDLRIRYVKDINDGLKSTQYERMTYCRFNYDAMSFLIKRYGKSNKQIADEIIEYINSEPIQQTGTSNTASQLKPESIVNLRRGYLEPIFYGYYSAYDHVALCWLFGKMMDLPKGFPMYTIDLKQTLDSMWYRETDKTEGQTRDESWLKTIKSHPNYPKETNAHNALADAKWNKELHDFINKLR